MEEPQYIELSEDMILLKNTFIPSIIGCQVGHWNLAMSLLIDSLYLLYNKTSITTLHNRSLILGEVELFIKANKTVIDNNKWSKNTANLAFYTMKNILKHSKINDIFLNKLYLPNVKTISRNSDLFCLPAQYKKKESSAQKLLLLWVDLIKKNTNYRAQTTIKQYISFILKYLSNINLDVNSWDNRYQKLTLEDIKKGLHENDTKIPLKTQINYIHTFFKKIIYVSHIESSEFDEWLASTSNVKSSKIGADNDIHRLGIEELQSMYNEAKKNVRDELIFMILITTGMRIGGLSKIKIENIYSQRDNQIIINKNGRTIEKGNKWFTFNINERVNELLYAYITEHRKGISSYLFPGRGEDIGLTTNRLSMIIKNIAKRANVIGPHVHPHSLRHSFAHMLLESGNEPALVAKMMGHSSSKTTEQYYLKESAAEVSKRVDIPWLQNNEKLETIPDFLKPKKDKNKVTDRVARLKLIKNSFK